jgi:hypothetical protein
MGAILLDSLILGIWVVAQVEIHGREPPIRMLWGLSAWQSQTRSKKAKRFGIALSTTFTKRFHPNPLFIVNRWKHH